MDNYEALGRYVYNYEQAKKHAQLRDYNLNELREYIDKILNEKSIGFIANDFDKNKLEVYTNRADEAHQNMINAITEANKHAAACEKPKLLIQE